MSEIKHWIGVRMAAGYDDEDFRDLMRMVNAMRSVAEAVVVESAEVPQPRGAVAEAVAIMRDARGHYGTGQPATEWDEIAARMRTFVHRYGDGVGPGGAGAYGAAVSRMSSGSWTIYVCPECGHIQGFGGRCRSAVAHQADGKVMLEAVEVAPVGRVTQLEEALRQAKVSHHWCHPSSQYDGDCQCGASQQNAQIDAALARVERGQ